MANDLFALEVFDGFDFRPDYEAVVPVVLRLGEVGQALFALGSLPIGFMMESTQKIDLAGEGELGAVRHGRCFGAADNMQVDLEAVFFHDLRFFEHIEKGEVGRVAGQ